MSPRTTSADRGDGRYVDAELCAESAVTTAEGRREATYLCDLGRREFAPSVAFSDRRTIPIPRQHVSGVVPVATKHEVGRIATRGIVARVADDSALGDLPVGNFPCDPMGKMDPSADAQVAVACGGGVVRPRPTLVGSADGDAIPEWLAFRPGSVMGKIADPRTVAVRSAGHGLPTRKAIGVWAVVAKCPIGGAFSLGIVHAPHYSTAMAEAGQEPRRQAMTASGGPGHWNYEVVA
jgi:hypothetical protein